MTKLRGNPWAVLVVVSLGFFMTLLDLTIVNIAIPNMIDKLHASLDGVLWVLNAYALVLAVLVITAGRLGDLLGTRTMFVAGIAVFTAASAACGFAPGAGWLIGFRAVQGLGAAMLMPQTLAIVTMTFPPERRGAAFGVWGAVAGLATIAGPTLGGLLVTAFDWRWIFFVNLPIGVLVLVLTFVIIPDLRLGRRHRLDIPGVLLASAALLAICYGLVEGQKYDWGTITSFISIPLILGAGVVLLVAFLVVQKLMQGREPLVPFAVFRDRNYAVTNWISGVLAVGMMGIFLPFTIYLQSVLDFSALKAGLAMSPMSLVSMFVAPLITVAMRNIDPRMAGAASGVLNTVRQVGLVIGTAAVGALLQNRLVASMSSQAAARSAALPPQVRGRFITEIQHTAKNGIQVGAGQNGGISKQSGLPANLVAEVGRIGHDVFTFGYVDAMRSTMVLPVVLLVVGAVSCLAIRGRKRPAEAGPAAPAATAESERATA